MINDEFTNSQSNNESFVNKKEFSKIQNSEFSDEGEMRLHKSAYNPDLMKQMNSGAESSTAGIETTTVTSSTASTVASATTSVIAVASTVAVTAISVVTGISVALHDYKYNFDTFVVTSNQFIYQLSIDDLKNKDNEYEYEDDQHYEEEGQSPFKLRVYNAFYDNTSDIWLGTNYGSFINLELGQKYNIVLSENRYGGKDLYSESFTTVINSAVTDFYLDPGANYYRATAEVYVDYIDELNSLSNFKLNLSREENGDVFSYDIPMRTTTGYQEINLLDITGSSIDLEKEYKYAFSYQRGEKEITFRKGIVQFYNAYNMVSEFRSFIFDGTANYIDQTFDVQLDYVDDYNIYSDFNLHLSSGYTGANGYEIDIPLNKTTAVQTIECQQYRLDVRNNETWNYVLSCNENGENKTLDEGQFTFSDNSGAIVQFNGLIFDKKANFDTREITLQLDYIDDLDYLSGFEFTLYDLDNGTEKTLYLTKTTEPQIFAIDEIDATDGNYVIDVRYNRMTYSFAYWNDTQRVTDAVTPEEFYFENSLVSTFTGIESNYDFSSEVGQNYYTLPIKFIFDDAAHEYDNFEVTFENEDNEIIAYLDFENENVINIWQYGYLVLELDHNEIDFDDYEIDIVVSIDISEQGTSANKKELYRQNQVFTFNEKKEIIDANLVSEDIVYGDYGINLLPVFSGQTSDFEVYVIIETSTNKTYTCPVRLSSQGSYMIAYLTSAEEGFNENAFADDFSGPVKLSLKYCTITYDYSDPTGESQIKSEYITIVLYGSVTFTLSA